MDFKKRISFLLALLLLLELLPMGGFAQTLSLDPVAEVIRPGQAFLIGFDASGEEDVSLVLKRTPESDTLLSVVALSLASSGGRNGVWWNGTYNGQPAPEGEGYLVLTQGENMTAVPVTVGPVVPMLADVSLSGREITPAKGPTLSLSTSCAGLLTVRLLQGNVLYTVYEARREAGAVEIPILAEGLSDGAAALEIVLNDDYGLTAEKSDLTVTLSGFAEEKAVEGMRIDDLMAETIPLFVEEDFDEIVAEEEMVLEDQHQFTPSWGSPYYGQDTTLNYWTLPMDITDEAAVWKMLTAPVTVVDTGKKNAQKTQVVIRAEPDEKAGGVGVVTCVSQSVHVLETLDNGWSLIECYSSSFHDSKVKAWNMLVQGYVQTSLLKTTVPDQTLGLVVDKLTQRLYIFKDGALFSTLLVSTGLANARQPYNETRSGEFLLQLPAVGEFRSDNLYCSLAIRFNDGDLLHEVPHLLNKDGSKNYSTTEYKLGTRGSHGCIRVQRKLTPEGTNMMWIWKNKKKNMKLVIWEDWQGRQLSYPDDDTVVYVNKNGGKMYHSAATCSAAKNVTFEPITYAELESDYTKLDRCEYCAPVLRRSEIDEINALHAPGGDHDPILTEARAKQAAVQ